MDLILWRHADAEDGAPDFGRKLTPRGEKDAARVAKWLLERLPAKFSVLASPAVRAQQTAGALGVNFKAAASLAPGASVKAVLAAAEWPSRKHPVVIVGHQPDLGCVAAVLVSGSEADWSIKKGGLWWLTGRERGGASQVVVQAVMAPEMI